MSIAAPPSTVSHIAPPAIGGDAALESPLLSDAELLRQFIRRRDQAAFAELVERFGPLVMSIALRSVRDLHAAEDVFQATFLVLARDARKIRSAESLRPWLHGTALRIARRALIRRRRESTMCDLQRLDDRESPLEALSRQAEQELVDEELQRLPHSYRAPLLLHLLEGRSCEETAALLGTSLGAVRGRIQRGKQELKLRLTRRGVEFPAVLAAFALWHSTAEAALQTPLAAATAAGGSAVASGTPMHINCSPEAVHLAMQESAMWSTGKLCLCAAALLLATACGWAAHSAAAPDRPQPLAADAPPRVSTLADFAADLPAAGPQPLLAYADPPATEKSADAAPATVLKYGDNQPDGRKSIAGTGEMIRFQLPDATQKLLSLRVHCSRYGFPQPPMENAEFSIVNAENSEVIHAEAVPYSTFKRGDNRWTTIRFKEPVAVPESFWVILDFDAAQTKGVYVSFDTSTGGEHSRTGLPGANSNPVSFGGDWMVQAILTKPGEAAGDAGDEDASSAAAAAPRAPDPQIVRTEPAIGATDVDPSLKSITVTFDRDMGKGMSWTGGGEEFPTVDKSRKARWVDARTCELPVVLSGGSYYRVGINSTSHQNFKAEDGVAARPSAIFFTTQGASEELQHKVQRPQIVSLEPVNGAKDVPPGTTSLKVTFDLPMGGGFSWVGSGAHFPGGPEGERPSWSEDRRTCTLPVILQSNWSYKLGLNSSQHINFQSAWGVPLEPVVYEFKTAEK